jgi:hypothetical protein
VGGEVVHHHDPSRAKIRKEDPLQVGFEHLGVDRAADGQSRRREAGASGPRAIRWQGGCAGFG